MAKKTDELVQFGIDPHICRYCRNKMRHECISECAPGGKYTHFTPVGFSSLDLPPQLPEYRKFRQMPPDARLAVVYLALVFIQSQLAGSGKYID